jgi:hypothetical protein
MTVINALEVNDTAFTVKATNGKQATITLEMLRAELDAVTSEQTERTAARLNKKWEEIRQEMQQTYNVSLPFREPPFRDQSLLRREAVIEKAIETIRHLLGPDMVPSTLFISIDRQWTRFITVRV